MKDYDERQPKKKTRIVIQLHFDGTSGSGQSSVAGYPKNGRSGIDANA